MDSSVASEITPEHRQRLAWFDEHQGQISPFPAPLRSGLLLATKAKGIYKPRDLPYALSVRINLDSTYPDGKVLRRADGSWSLAYHQENRNPANRDAEYTNRGLMQCIADRIPIGVLRERRPKGGRSEYDVLGLAIPVRWYDGYFFLESLDGEDSRRGDTVTEVLTATAVEQVEAEASEAPRSPDNFSALLRIHRQIVTRRGQSALRSALLAAYDGRCVVTGCTAEAVLEVGRIWPGEGPELNSLHNSLLLRADIHTLFDLQLLAIDPRTNAVVVSRLLQGTEYVSLGSRQLIEPAKVSQRPAAEYLQRAWQDFVEAESER
jgi:hypothetical protein